MKTRTIFKGDDMFNIQISIAFHYISDKHVKKDNWEEIIYISIQDLIISKTIYGKDNYRQKHKALLNELKKTKINGEIEKLNFLSFS